MRYRHLFFDLDHTLWDFQANSRTVLAELCDEVITPQWNLTAEVFIPVYEQVNDALWKELVQGRITGSELRAKRFARALTHFGIPGGGWAWKLENMYLGRCPFRTALMPGAQGLLADLAPHYRMHIITNGFTRNQDTKLRASGIRHHFHVMLTSEMAGAPKPSRRIFQRAMRNAGASAQESLMIGDNAQTDVAGGQAAGIDQVHFAPQGRLAKEATYRIRHLDELRSILL